MRTRAADGGVTRRVLGEIGCVDEWLPIQIDFRSSIAVLVPQPNSRDRSPKRVKVLGFPASDLGVGEGGFGQRIHARRVADVIQVVSRDVAQGILPQHWTAIRPEIANVSLFCGTCRAEQRTNRFYFFVVARPFFAG